MTKGEWFKSALMCEGKEEADKWLAQQAQGYSLREHCSFDMGKAMVLKDLGYFAGYYSAAVQQKVMDLFGAAHPGPGALVDAAKRAKLKIKLHDFGPRGTAEVGKTMTLGNGLLPPVRV